MSLSAGSSDSFGGGAPASTVAVVGVRFQDLEIEKGVLEPVGARLVTGAGSEADEIVATAKDAEVVMTGSAPRFTESVLRRLPRCRAIVRYGIGVDNVDVVAAARLGIAVLNVTDYCTDEVATHTVALILTLNRRLLEADRTVRAGAWSLKGLEGVRAPQDEVVGIVGAGAIGSRVGHKLLALGFQCLVHDPYLEVDWAPMVGLDQLLAGSDYVTLHMPLVDSTRHLIDARALRLMRPASALVNTGRGGLVAEDALLEALASGHLRAAALDVFEQEPPSPEVELTRRQEVIATPHMAWYSGRSQLLLRRRAAEQAALVLTGGVKGGDSKR